MSNLVDETLLEIVIALERQAIRLGTWEQDAIQKILVTAFTWCFEEGRRAGLKDVLAFLEVKGIDYVKKL